MVTLREGGRCVLCTIIVVSCEGRSFFKKVISKTPSGDNFVNLGAINVGAIMCHICDKCGSCLPSIVACNFSG